MNKKTQKLLLGFSLMELMVVLAIISILALIALPSQMGRGVQLNVVETLELVEPYKEKISLAYQLSGEWLSNNESAGLPEPEQILGNYLSSVTLSDGAMHLELGQKLSEPLHGKIISVRPVFVDGSLDSPVSWVCGFDAVPEGMSVAGKNLTDVDVKLLPLSCR